MLLRFWSDETGATAVEYGLIAALICLVMITGFGKFANALEFLFSDNNSKLVQGLN